MGPLEEQMLLTAELSLQLPLFLIKIIIYTLLRSLKKFNMFVRSFVHYLECINEQHKSGYLSYSEFL